uniref:peptidylprolyl isomerase n=1 Tax=Strigamia maritima TaxID=126957 RepID=T1IHK7_STRMM
MATTTTEANVVDEDLGVELESGLDITSLREGTMFDIKVPLDHKTDFDAYPDNYDNFLEEELLKYSKTELLAVSSDEELEDLEKTPFEKMRNEWEDISPEQDKCIVKQLKRPGFGGALPDNALVTVHYNAYLDNFAEPFDSTYLQKKPMTFRLNEGKVLLGLNIAVRSMKIKEQSEFLVSPDYAYGPIGCPDRIPPNSSILFVVEVISVVDNVAMVEFNNLTHEEQSLAGFKELMKVARAKYATGVDSEKRQRSEKALPEYLYATRLLENATYANETDEAEGRQLLLKLYKNITRLSFTFKQYRKCCKYGHEAMKIDTNCAKALYWVGRACTQLGEWNSAKKYLVKLRRMDPSNEEAVKALDILNKLKNEEDLKEKNLYRRMFPGAAKMKVKIKEQLTNERGRASSHGGHVAVTRKVERMGM